MDQGSKGGRETSRDEGTGQVHNMEPGHNMEPNRIYISYCVNPIVLIYTVHIYGTSIQKLNITSYV